ncbi:hypothetical protein [Bradyrhizobium sp. S3.9.1]|jgi:hypothetical protein|uniref:hypothetical protein n=1 Tax=Bradyrhizobium sp. S3.9.1 TaxID=3156431 RepID=UPI0033996B78
MRTIIYVDGFNLYYRMLEKRPDPKWLNIKQLCVQFLKPENIIIGVRSTPRRVDPLAPARQQVYFDALATIPEISLHMGSFLSAKKFSGLVHPPAFRPPLANQLPQPRPAVVKVHKTEEKGRDAYLASHLLLGAFRNDYDVAAVLSNDTDLVEPKHVASQDFSELLRSLSNSQHAFSKRAQTLCLRWCATTMHSALRAGSPVKGFAVSVISTW